MSNSLDPDETPSNSASHLDLCRLHMALWYAQKLQIRNNTIKSMYMDGDGGMDLFADVFMSTGGVISLNKHQFITE